MLYGLTLLNERQETFFIGLFESDAIARQTAERYRSAVPGFRDFPCTYHITEKQVIGEINFSRKVYMIWGWDEDQEGRDVGVWSSDCYAERQEAERALAAVKQSMHKGEWSIDPYSVGQCRWAEGYVRILNPE